VRALAEYSIAFVEFLEAEGRMLRPALTRVMLSSTLIAVSGLLLFAGTALLLWSLFGALVHVMPYAAAALITGFFTLAIMGLLVAVAVWIARL
jgi:hypothetical protein